MSDNELKTYLADQLYAFKQDQAERDATFKFELANHIAETIKGQVGEAVRITVNGKIDKMQKQNDDIMVVLRPMADAFRVGSLTTQIVFAGAKIIGSAIVLGAIIIGIWQAVQGGNWKGVIHILSR